MEFPSAEWVAEWASRANDDPACVAAGAGFAGAVAAVINSDEIWRGGPTFIRLEGENGVWTRSDYGLDEGLTANTLFTLSADFTVWKSIFQQQLDPIRGLIQGRLRMRGQLSSVLRWTRPFRLMTALAADLPTTFANEGVK